MIVRPLVLLLATAACTAPSPVAWQGCPKTPDLECSTTTVPVDWDRPGGRSITLDVARLKATDPDKRIGVVLFNPGGPGASGISALARAKSAFAGLRTRFDVVTWDPRGTLLAKAPSCVDGPVSDAPADRADYERKAKDNAALVARCRDTDPELFDHSDSASQARDMDQIRKALGEDTISYFGQSYGGVFGVTYARLFPGRLRAMALDGIINHTADNAALEAMMQTTNQRAFTEFAARHPREAAAWRDLLTRAPIPVKGAPKPLSYNAFDLQNAAYTLLIDNAKHAELAAAINQARQGDATLFAARAGQRKFWTPAFGLATQCADGFRYENYDDYAVSAEREKRTAPDFPTFRSGYQASTCAGFPVPTRNPRGPLSTAKLPPLLGVSGLVNQPETQDVIRRVPNSTMLPIQKWAHVLYQHDPAARDQVDHYFTG
ncbi:alpha/beta fold hydrolase [Allokutzneria oryzae]|uniref:Alpha/beta fold hydrolase n=1 Tax=Allokutzneria oryzae TaxID=1378989 RepID=A0ABV5ZPP0_9PSEU